MLKDDAGNVGLRALDDSLKTQLQAWFALGFLQLRQVTWDATPANILEKVSLIFVFAVYCMSQSFPYR